MVYIALAFAVGLFAIGLRMIGVVPRARRVFGDANQALRIMQAPDLSDDQKAVRIRSASLDMFGAFFAILSPLPPFSCRPPSLSSPSRLACSTPVRPPPRAPTGAS